MPSKLGKKWNKRGQWQRSFPQRAKSAMKCYEKRWDRQAQRQNTQVGWQTTGVSFSFQAGWEITITPTCTCVCSHTATQSSCAQWKTSLSSNAHFSWLLCLQPFYTHAHTPPHTHTRMDFSSHQNRQTFQHRQTSLHFFRTWVISSSFSGLLKWVTCIYRFVSKIPIFDQILYIIWF